jgi:hypothetical protein
MEGSKENTALEIGNESSTILLTIDVEDWVQVENFKGCIPFSSWSSYELRVEKNTHRILDLLDSVKVKNTEYSRQNTEAQQSAPFELSSLSCLSGG